MTCYYLDKFLKGGMALVDKQAENILNLKNRKKALKLTTADLALLCEIPVGTLSKIMTGETKNPSYLTIEKIETVLAHQEMLKRLEAYRQEMFTYFESHPEIDYDQTAFEILYRKKYDLNNAPIGYAVPKSETPVYHVGNLALHPEQMRPDPRSIAGDIDPADRFAELIDGTIYHNQMPGSTHQLLVDSLAFTIRSFLLQNDKSCLVNSSGMNVFLDEDEFTMVIPDLFILCDRAKLTDSGVCGAPDLVMEVTSPGTRRMDYGKKCWKYLASGVQEYWIIDLEKEQVTVYLVGQPTLASLYTFQDQIPVRLYDNELSLCIQDLKKNNMF